MLENYKHIHFNTLVNTYVIEVFEIFLILCLIRFILGKDVSMYVILKHSLFIGLIVLIIGLYNIEFKDRVKLGMLGSMSARLVSLD